MDAKEIVHTALQIEKFTADRSYGDIMTLLVDLDECHVTAEQLETTDIVKVLYRVLKTCPDDGVKKTVKSLLSKWKRQYSKGAGGVRCKEESKELSCRVSLAEGGAEEEQETKPGLKTCISTAESSSASPDSTRTKCVELILAALRPEPPDRDKAAELAADIEQHIHQLHTHNQVKYKACVRSKVANLRNPKNSHLRQGLLSGSLPPEAFARMSAEEMAGAELRRLREEYSSRGVSERQLPQGVEGTQTQKVRCRRCGGSDCRVMQMNRGALFLPAWVRRGGPDEDAMTFVTCSGCGQQWYHSGWICL